MKLAEIRKALVPIVTSGLIWAAEAAGIAPELITAEVAGAVTALLVMIAAAVYQIPNKEQSK